MKILWKSVWLVQIYFTLLENENNTAKDGQENMEYDNWKVLYRGFTFIKVMHVFFQKHPDNLRVPLLFHHLCKYSLKEFLSTLRRAFQHVYTFTVHKSIRGVKC